MSILQNQGITTGSETKKRKARATERDRYVEGQKAQIVLRQQRSKLDDSHNIPQRDVHSSIRRHKLNI